MVSPDFNKILKEVEQQELNKQYIKKQPKGIKIASEQEQRRELLWLAKQQGCEQELRMILDKYDNLLRNCTNSVEKKHISYLGICEIHKLLNVSGGLSINGETIIEGDFAENPGKIIKI